MSLEYTTMPSAVGKDADAAALRESLMMSGIDWNLESSLNPGQPLPEITRLELNKDGGGGSTSSLLSGGVASPSRKTMKEYEQQQKSLEEENFSLKLRVYMLEERLFGKERPTGPEGADKTGEQLIELKVQLAALRDELAQKKSLLRAAAETLDKLERQNAADVEAERQRWQGSVADLQRQLEEAQSAAERAASAASDEPYLKAFEPLTTDHAAPAADADQLASLEGRMAELQAALVEMKETVGERDEEVVTLRRQLEEARSAATRTAQRADNTERQLAQARDQLTTREQLQVEQGRQLQLQLAESEAETQRLRQQLSEVEALPRVKELQRTCEQLTAGRAADGARLSELLTAQQKADDKLRASAANEALVKSAMKTLRTELEERKKQLTAARAELRRARERNLTLIDEMRDMHKLVESKFEQETPTSVASEGADTPAAESRPPTPHEVQVYLLRTETQRKDKKIRSLVAEMKEMNDMLMKYRWEVKEVAEEENERLWTELEENKKLIKELQDEKMELVLEKERQIQRLLGQLKDREPAGGGGAAGTELQQQLELRDCHLAASSRELRQTRDQLGRLRADSERSAAELQEVQQQAQSVRSQLAHAALQVRERDALLAQLRDRLLQQRRLLDAPPEAPQLRQLAAALEQLCEELAAPRPGPPDADAVGGAGEMVAESSESTAARSEEGELGAEKTAALRAQLVDLREQLAVRERQLPELEEQAAAAEQLRSALEECQQQLRAADQRLSELAPLPDRLAEAQQQLTELGGLRNALAERERDLALAEGELNEVAELREQLTSRERQLAAAVGQRAELQQTRQLLAEREEEKASLLRHLDEQRRQHEREASALQERFEVTLTAPTWQQYRDAQQRHSQEEARLRRRLAESSGACQLLQQRLEELADFMELLLNLEERGVLDLSCLTAQHLQDLQRSLLQSRELSQSLTQSVLQHLDMEDAIEVSTASLADQSSLHIPPLEENPAPTGSENKASEEGPLNSTTTSETVEVHKPTSGKGKTKKTKATKTKSADKKTAVSEKNKSSSLPPPAPKSKKPVKSSADTAGTAEPPASKATAEAAVAGLPPAEPAPRSGASSRDSSAQASGAPVSESAVQAGCASVSEFGVQTSSAEAGDLVVRASDAGAEAGDTDAGEPALLHLREQLEARSARLEALTAQLAGRDAQLVRQAALVETLQLQLQQAAGRTSTTELPLSVNAEAGGDSARLPVVREPLPGEVRDSFRWLVQRQRTSERSSGTDTPPPTQQQPTVERASGTDPPPPEEKDSDVDPHHQLSRTVERALSPILSVARAQSAELLQLHPAAPPPPLQVQQSRSAETLRSRTASSAAASDGSDTVQETRQRGGRTRPRPPQEPVRDAAAAVPPVGDYSESEAWSEPDRDVSLARIGLDQSSLGTRTESWLGTHSESDSRHSRRRGRGGPQEVQELEAHIESLQQVKKALRAEVDIYQQVLPGDQHDKPADGKTQAGVMVPMEVLSEIHGLQQQLERAISANERIRRQMQLTPRRAAEAPNQDLALALKITQEQLSEANERLEATQQRCDELRAKLNRAKENLRLAQLNAEQFKDKFVRVSDDMVHLRQRFNQMEADREQQSEEARRRRHQQQESAAVRCLERELERARAASRDQEAEVQQLRQQLTAQPAPEAPSGGSDKENRSVTEHYPDANVRASRSESQLVELNREKLRLLSARKQAESRGRLLRSESCLLDGEQRQAEQRRRLEAAKWAGWETERERLQTENGQLREERARLRRQLVTSGADAGRAARRSLQAEAERARQAEARLAAEHAQCERRLSELSRVMSSDKERLGEVSAQLEEVNAEMETMRAKLNELDEAGQSCPESTRSCDLPAAPQTPPGEMTQPRSSVSDGHDANHESDRTSSYSSPDLGIESDCNRCLSCSSQTVRRTDDEPEPTPSETELLRQERDQMQTKLAATRTALQEALDKLTRADQRKARVERAIYRQLSKTHDILRRAKNNLAPPAAGDVPPPPDQ